MSDMKKVRICVDNLGVGPNVFEFHTKTFRGVKLPTIDKSAFPKGHIPARDNGGYDKSNIISRGKEVLANVGIDLAKNLNLTPANAEMGKTGVLANVFKGVQAMLNDGMGVPLHAFLGVSISGNLRLPDPVIGVLVDSFLVSNSSTEFNSYLVRDDDTLKIFVNCYSRNNPFIICNQTELDDGTSVRRLINLLSNAFMSPALAMTYYLQLTGRPTHPALPFSHAFRAAVYDSDLTLRQLVNCIRDRRDGHFPPVTVEFPSKDKQQEEVDHVQAF